MANRYFPSQFLFSFNHMPVMVECNCIIDSGQTSGTRSLKGSGVTSITHISTGVYEIVLNDTYARYLGGNAGFAVAPGSTSGIAVIEVEGDPNTTITDLSKRSFRIHCLNFSGALADPANGSVLGMNTWLRNSSVKGAGE